VARSACARTGCCKPPACPRRKLLLDVRPTASTICRRDVFTASAHQTFLSVYRKMMEHNFRSIPIVDDEGRLLGMPAIQEMAQLFLPARMKKPWPPTARCARACSTSSTPSAASADGDTRLSLMPSRILCSSSPPPAWRPHGKRAQQFPAKSSCHRHRRPSGDSRPGHRDRACAASSSPGASSPGGILTQAGKEKGVAIISPYDTASTSQLLRFSRPIGEALTHEFLPSDHAPPLREIIHTGAAFQPAAVCRRR
jgi:manganese-dependent inorganic pyrophosphatase